jgi:hypothetical protein
MYQGFAEIYDELMNDVDYEAWADYYCRLLSIFGVKSGKICAEVWISVCFHRSESGS